MKKFMNTLEKYMTDLHLVSWQRPKMTELVIKTIRRNTEPGTYRLIVLDNNSDDATQLMLQTLYRDQLIDKLMVMDYNAGLEMARQYLLDTSASTEYFVCIDNDCLPPSKKDGHDWLSRMLDLMAKYETYAAISMRTQVMIGSGNIFEGADVTGDDIVDFPHPGGSFRIMNTGTVREVGGWDRGSPGRGSEETYIGAKLNEAGYGTAFATDIRCLHLFGTRGKNGTDRWGYDKKLKPEDTGHNDVSHPALEQGDDREELLLFAGAKDVDNYYKK